jgi:hypothetical protein
MTGFYPRLRDRRGDDVELQDCIETVVNRLEQHQTSEDNPGMLLGKIQSGKTRGFLGVIAKAFDRGYDIALVFTKGTKTLATQTRSSKTRKLRSSTSCRCRSASLVPSGGAS